MKKKMKETFTVYFLSPKEVAHSLSSLFELKKRIGLDIHFLCPIILWHSYSLPPY